MPARVETKSVPAAPPYSRRSAILVLAAIAVIAALPRFYELGHPAGTPSKPTYVFDEVYYAKDACLYAGVPYKQCGLEANTEQSWVHPPLGKWMIAGGIKAFGNRPFGWRFSAAVVGTITVVALALMTLLLFESLLWSFVAGLLLATESLEFVQSRTAMLDIFVAFWTTLGFLFLVLDRRWIERRDANALRTGEDDLESTPVTSPIWRPWRLVAGIAFGAAAATKWDGIWALVAGIVISIVWETGRRRRAGYAQPSWRPLQAFRSAVARQDSQRRDPGWVPARGAGIDYARPARTYAFWKAIQQESFGLVLFFVVVPVAVYLASYIGFFIDNGGFHLSLWWDRQTGMLQFHRHLLAFDPDTGKKSHPYQAPPWSWLVLARPVAYYYTHYSNDTIRAEVLGIGNPIVFWLSLIAIPYTAMWGWARRDWRAGFIVAALLLQYLPWFAFSNRVQFLFYATPLTPFLVLAVLYFVRDISGLRIAGSRSRPFLPVAVGIVVVSVAAFAFFYPVLVGWHISTDAWKARMWFSSWI